VERRLDPRSFADLVEQLSQQSAPLVAVFL
jgi:hypothetical protein